MLLQEYFGPDNMELQMILSTDGCYVIAWYDNDAKLYLPSKRRYTDRSKAYAYFNKQRDLMEATR